MKEARLKLEGAGASKNDMLVIFGCGAGYLLDCAANEFGVENFLIVEPDPGIINLSLKREGTVSVIEKRGNRVYYFDNTNLDPEYIFGILLLCVAKPLKIIESGYFRKTDEKFLMKALETVKTSYISVLEVTKKFGDSAVSTGIQENDDPFLKLASELVFYESEEDRLL
jgi:hypothetical protein